MIWVSYALFPALHWNRFARCGCAFWGKLAILWLRCWIVDVMAKIKVRNDIQQSPYADVLPRSRGGIMRLLQRCSGLTSGGYALVLVCSGQDVHCQQQLLALLAYSVIWARHNIVNTRSLGPLNPNWERSAVVLLRSLRSNSYVEGVPYALCTWYEGANYKLSHDVLKYWLRLWWRACTADYDRRVLDIFRAVGVVFVVTLSLARYSWRSRDHFVLRIEDASE